MIVVSGASGGIGQGIIKRLTGRGENVVGLSRNTNNLNCKAIECDVRNFESIKNAVIEIKKFGVPVDAFINCAGVASMNLVMTSDEESIRDIVETNLLGTIYSNQMISRIMVRQKAGVILNFSTIAVGLGIKGEAAYAASKSGVETFTRIFAKEVSAFNVRINCIAPGPIATNLIKGISEKKIGEIVSQQVIQKQFHVNDVCDLVETLIDSKTKTISGHTINIGGY